MRKNNRINEAYIYDKPECILIRRVFMAFVLYFLCGLLVTCFNIEELIGENKWIMYENNSMLINLVAGYLLTEGFASLKQLLVWLKEKVYDSKAVEYAVNENKENLVPCIDGTKYLLYRSIERQVIKTVEDFLNGDKKENLFIFLPSTPGMGKSSLLKEIRSDLTAKGIEYVYHGGYFDCLQQNLSENIIILDDFEDVFLYSNDIRKIKILFENSFNERNEKYLVVVAFASETLTDVLQLFDSVKGNKKFEYLQYKEEDEHEIECRLLSSVGVSVWNYSTYNYDKIMAKLKVIKTLLNELKSGIVIPIVEIAVVAKILVKEGNSTISKWEEDIIKNDYSYRDYFVGKYLYSVILKSNHTIMCSIILYSLAKASSLKQKVTYESLQELYYFETDTLTKIIQHLEENKLIKKNMLGYSRERNLVLASKYWEDKIFSIVKNILDSTVIFNIDTYFSMKNKIHMCYSDNCYEEYQNGINWVKKILCYSIFGCIFLNVRNYYYCQESSDYYFFAMLNCLSGLNVLYTYNYMYHFLLPCKNIFKFNMLVNGILLCAQYYFYDYWFLFWGAGMLLQIISLIALGKKAFKKDIFVFSMIGILVTGLGSAVYALCNYLSNTNLAEFIPYVKIGSMIIVCAIMIGALARHIILSYLLGNIMKVKCLGLIYSK